MQKGFDLLISAVASLYPKYPEWQLVIVGEGPERPALERQAARLGLANVVHFPGWVSQPYDYYHTAGVFVLSSRFEGFPNALLEAMAAGCAVVATDCPSGPKSIVSHGVNGLLVPSGDPQALALALGRLLADEGERARFGLAARGVLDRFAPGEVLPQWSRLFMSLQPTSGP